jgi:hypothetical protein
MKPLLCLTLLGAAIAAPLHAAPIELTASTTGTGVVQIGSSGDRITKANVVLKRDGKFTIGLVGSEDTRFSGTWQPSGRDNVLLRLREADGREARGSGNIDLRARRGDYEVDSLVLSGETERGRSISARFSAPRYVPIPVPPPAPRVVLDAERSGFGRLQVGGRDSYRINRVHVQLFTDGRAHVHTEGSTALRYEGSWTPGGETTATLTVRGGLDGERLTGIVRHRAGRFWRVELTGTRAGRYHSLEFEPGR